MLKKTNNHQYNNKAVCDRKAKPEKSAKMNQRHCTNIVRSQNTNQTKENIGELSNTHRKVSQGKHQHLSPNNNL